MKTKNKVLVIVYLAWLASLSSFSYLVYPHRYTFWALILFNLLLLLSTLWRTEIRNYTKVAGAWSKLVISDDRLRAGKGL